MGRWRVALVVCCTASLAVAAGVGTVAARAAPRRRPRRRIRGFSAAASAAEAARERELKAMPSAKAAEADFDVMTAEPHHAGSPYEIKLADYVSDQFKQFGLEVVAPRLQHPAFPGPASARSTSSRPIR